MATYQGLHVGDELFPWTKRTHFIGWKEFMSFTVNAINDTNDYALGVLDASPATAGAPTAQEIGATSTDIGSY